jgi:hypothetical protein
MTYTVPDLEPHPDDTASVPGAAIDPAAGLTPAQLAHFIDLIEKGRQPHGGPGETLGRRYDFPRGWNEAADYTLKMLERVQREA